VSHDQAADRGATIDVRELDRRRREVGGAPGGPLVVDVRELGEVVTGRIDGAVILPLSQFVARFRELPVDRPLMIVCQSGNRSGMATAFLAANGYQAATNVTGGMTAWRMAGLPIRSGPLAAGEGEPPTG
jgi:rhodanese-related sulfurtransferase